MCRMAADSTYLCDKQEPAFSSKLQRIDELLERVFSEPGRKAVLFSEWTTMLDLIEKTLERHGLEYVRLDGSASRKMTPSKPGKFGRHRKSPRCC